MNVFDLVRATAATESENQSRVRRVFGLALVTCHGVDIGAALLFYAWESPRLFSPPGDLRFHDSALDTLCLAVGRAVVFPLLTVAAVVFGKTTSIPVDVDRRDSTVSEEGYIALRNMEEETPAPSVPLKKRQRGWVKHVALAFIFVLSALCQVYVGIKVHSYHWRRKKTWPEILVLCSSVLWTNLAAYFARELATELTRDDALYLPKVHAHGLVFDASIIHHWCDLCSTPIRDKGGYRCKLCDFDICLKCASRKDAAVVGEHLLRTDAGVPIASQESLSSANYLMRAISLAKSRSCTLAGALCVLGMYSALSLALPNYQGKIIDRVVKDQRSKFATAAETYLVLMIISGALRAVYSALFSIVSRSVLYEIRTRLFRSLLRQDVAFFDGTTSGHLSSRLTNDAQTMMAPIDASLSSLVYNVILLIGGIVMCFYTSYALSMLAFVVVGPIMYAWEAYARWSKRLTRQVLAAWAEANSIATEAIAHVRTVKAFASEDNETSRYETACRRGLNLGIKDALGFGVTSALTSYLDLGTGVLILWYGGLIVLNHRQGDRALTVGRLVTYQLYWSMMNSSYQSLQGLVTSFTRAAAAAEKVFSLIDTMPAIDSRDRQGTTKLGDDVQGALRLEDVDFYYAMRPEKMVLRNVTLDIPAKKTFALVGRSGGGKSTIISLLLRFYDPRGGRVTLDGVDVTSMDVRSYRRLFGVVMQDTPLMANSIRGNMTYGMDDDVPLTMVKAAAKAAFALDFVDAMTDGFDTRVGERGGRLSGGQRQRIAIARIFLREPKLCLLDEATSALDEESQFAVQKSLDALISRGGSTVVLVAHRLSTVMASDNIAVIDHGKVREQGNHSALVQHGGIYAALVQRQLSHQQQHASSDSSATTKKLKIQDIDSLLDELDKNGDPASASDNDDDD